MDDLVRSQREHFRSGRTRPVAARKKTLRAIRTMMEEEGDRLADAIGRDLGRCWLESWSAEPGLVLADVRYALRHVSSWCRGHALKPSPPMLPGWVKARPEPFGTAVIIGPWNYPAGLLLSPMVSAIAAGNTVMLKPSERAPETASVLEEMIGARFPREVAAVVRGGGSEGRWLIRNAADIVCFTGSIPTGRSVMEDAASGPVPAVLELGGINPCFVDADAHLRSAARRIAWGKFFGAGQTCLAPNHVIVDGRVEGDFLGEMERAVEDFYGSDPRASDDYGRLIDEVAWDRLAPLLGEGVAVTGGESSREERYIAPTVLTGLSRGSHLLQQEIFGPILPVVPCDSVEDAMRERGPSSSLAAYGFSKRSGRMEALLRMHCRAGSITVNGTLHRIVSSSIGFGGVGESGFGRYRGVQGFRQFSWEQVILRKNPRFEMPMLYPPYRIGRGFVRMLTRFF